MCNLSVTNMVCLSHPRFNKLSTNINF
uniref:Uncharacterized protein n=1 Tax=Vitis vinifera TaxID=29760 RepID=F6HD04_VITVI